MFQILRQIRMQLEELGNGIRRMRSACEMELKFVWTFILRAIRYMQAKYLRLIQSTPHLIP